MAKQAHLQAIISAVDRLTPTLNKIGVNTTKTKALLGALNGSSFAKLRGTLNVVSKSVADVGGALRNASQQLLPLAGLGAVSLAGLGFGFLAASRGAISYAASVQDAADITGIAYGEVQKWHGLFRNGGVGVEESTQAIVKFGEQARAAATGGNKSFHALLTRLRIPLRDVKGQLRPVNDLMLDFADGVAAQTNPITRNAILIAAFGKAGSKMVPAFKDGAASMRELLDQQERMGKVLDEDGGAALDALGKKQVELGQQLRVLTANILSRAAPAFDKLFQKAQSWVSANREIISQRMSEVIGRVADRLTAWIEGGGFERLAAQARDLWQVIVRLLDRVGGLGNVMKALGLLVLAGPLASLVSLSAAVGRLAFALLPVLTQGIGLLLGPLGALIKVVRAGQVVMLGMSLTLGQLALVALPVVAVAAALAGVAYLIYRNWGLVGPFLAGVWERIKTVATVGWNVLRFLFSWSPLGIIAKNWGAILSWVGAFWAQLSGVVSAGLALVDGLLTSWGVYDTIKAIWEPVVSFISGVWDRIKGFVGPILGLAGKVAGAFGGAVSQQFGAQASGREYGPRIAAAPTPLMQAGAMQASRMDGAIKVDFANVPAGVRVSPESGNARGITTSVDYGMRSMGGMG